MKQVLCLALMAVLCLGLSLFVSCDDDDDDNDDAGDDDDGGGDDDTSDDDDQTNPYEDDCTDYCQKVFACGTSGMGADWEDAAACVEACTAGAVEDIDFWACFINSDTDLDCDAWSEFVSGCGG